MATKSGGTGSFPSLAGCAWEPGRHRGRPSRARSVRLAGLVTDLLLGLLYLDFFPRGGLGSRGGDREEFCLLAKSRNSRPRVSDDLDRCSTGSDPPTQWAQSVFQLVAPGFS